MALLRNAFNNIELQKRALDASWLKQDVIANNIANAETPGYKRQEVRFESFLNDAMASRMTPMTKTHANHMGVNNFPSAQIHQSGDFSLRIDGNNVNIDVEMAEQAKNSIRYNALINQVSSQISRIKNAIKGG